MMHGESDGWFTFVAGHSSNPLHESEGKSGKKKEMLRDYCSLPLTVYCWFLPRANALYFM